MRYFHPGLRGRVSKVEGWGQVGRFLALGRDPLLPELSSGHETSWGTGPEPPAVAGGDVGVLSHHGHDVHVHGISHNPKE